MRCLQVNKFWYPRGGADVYALQVASQLVHRGHTVRALAVAHPRNIYHPDARFWPRYYELGEGGAHLQWRDKAAATARVVYNRSAVRAVRAILEVGDVDVAHVHNFIRHLSPAPLLELRRRGIPIVATLHDAWPICPTYVLVQGDGALCEWQCTRGGVGSCVRHRCVEGRIGASLVAAVEFSIRLKLRWGLDLCDALVAPSHFLADSIRRELSTTTPLHVIRHPWPRCEWELPPRSGPLRVLYLGRLAKEKGVDVLIDAIRGSTVNLTVAGRGPLEDDLRRRAGTSSSITFVGFLDRDALREALRSTHVVAIPSTCHENAPMTLLEATAAGRVVLASRIGGIPEYAQIVPNVRLVDPGDSIAWREALDSLAQDPARVAEMGRETWEAAQRQAGWSEHMASLETVYTHAGAR